MEVRVLYRKLAYNKRFVVGICEKLLRQGPINKDGSRLVLILTEIGKSPFEFPTFPVIQHLVQYLSVQNAPKGRFFFLKRPKMTLLVGSGQCGRRRLHEGDNGAHEWLELRSQQKVKKEKTYCSQTINKLIGCQFCWSPPDAAEKRNKNTQLHGPFRWIRNVVSAHLEETNKTSIKLFY